MPSAPKQASLLARLLRAEARLRKLETRRNIIPNSSLNSPVLPMSANNDNPNFNCPNIDLGGSVTLAARSNVAVPDGYHSLIAMAVGAVGGTAPTAGDAYVLAQVAISLAGEPLTAANTAGQPTATFVPAGRGNSAYSFFSVVRIGDLPAGSTISFEVYGGSSAQKLSGGNGHISGMALFLR